MFLKQEREIFNPSPNAEAYFITPTKNNFWSLSLNIIKAREIKFAVRRANK